MPLLSVLTFLLPVALAADHVSQSCNISSSMPEGCKHAASLLQKHRHQLGTEVGLAGRSAYKVKRSFQKRWLTGSWEEDGTSFRWSNETDFMFLWDVPQSLNAATDLREGLNVTAQEALRSVGPLSLLLVLRKCLTEPRELQETGTLASAIRQARSSGHLKIHILGVNGIMEPTMSWDHFLVGPLSPSESRLVDAFGLPVTPFAGLHVSVVFSIYGDNHPPQFVQRKDLVSGYSEVFAYGLYHEVVHETPDLAIALNPGFAHYPLQWWPSLARLRSRKVPIVATGYGAYMHSVYEYDKRISPQRHGLFSLKLPAAHRVSTGTETYWWAPGGVYRMDQSAVHEVESFSDERGRTIKLHRFPSTALEHAEAPKAHQLSDTCGVPPASHLQVPTLCSDLDGIAYLASRTGYGLSLAVQMPFKYCDDPLHGACASGDVVTLLEDLPSLGPVSETPPQWLARDTLLKAVPCAGQAQDHQDAPPALLKCLESQIHTLVAPDAADNMDSFFENAIPACASSLESS